MGSNNSEVVLTVILPEEDYAERLAKAQTEGRKMWEDTMDAAITEGIGA